MALAENVRLIERMNKTQRKKVPQAVLCVWQLHGGTQPALCLTLCETQKNLKSNREFMWGCVYSSLSCL